MVEGEKMRREVVFNHAFSQSTEGAVKREEHL